MTPKKHKILLAILCLVAVGLFVATAEDPILKAQKTAAKQEEMRRQGAAKKVEADRQEAEKRRVAAEKEAAEWKKQREAAEMERQKRLHEARAKMPPFSFAGFALSDAPQQIIEKALAGYSISTSFPVEQEGETIVRYAKEVNLGTIDGVNDAGLDDFFHYHRERAGFLISYDLRIAKAIKETGLFVDVISLNAKEEDHYIRYYYVTLPGGEPQPLYMAVTGDLVRDVPTVFEKRYGDHKHIHTSRLWFSNTELAMTQIDLHHLVLYIVNKKNYDNVWKYVRAEENKIRDKERAAREAEEKARQGKI